MGANNHLEIPWSDGGINLVQFKWGEVREYRYKIGDKIAWGLRDRPPEADGAVWIGGCATTGDYEIRNIQGREHEVPVFAYFRLRFENDRLLSFEQIGEEDYDRLRNERSS